MEYSDHARELLSKYYMVKEDKSPKDALKRASFTYAKDKDLAERVYQYAEKGWMMFSSPILSNAGRGGLPISCFLNYVDDSVAGLISHTEETRWMSVVGGGVGGHWSSVRSVSDKSPGPIPFLRTMDADMSAYRQSSTRKGSYATYMDISHPDIIEFINIRVPTGGDINRKCFNLHNAVNITDDFMEAVYEGRVWELKDPNSGEVKETIDARDLWERLVDIRFKTGEPYFCFTDTANRALPASLKEKGLEIRGSNLCVTGDQRVVTNRGILTAKELYEQGGDLIVADNKGYRNASPMQLIERNASVYKVTLKNGLEHTITAYHRVSTERGNVECQDLVEGDRVYIQNTKGLFGSVSMEDEAFLLGLYQADGTQTDKMIFLDLWEDNFDLLDEVKDRYDRVHYKYGCDTYEIERPNGRIVTRGLKPAQWVEQNTGVSDVRKMRLRARTLKNVLDFKKGEIPQWIWEGTEETQWQYIRGLFYADGTCTIASGNGNPIYLSISNTDKDFLKDLMLILRNLGIRGALHKGADEGLRPMPDGKGGVKDYFCKATWRIVIGNKNDAQTFEENTGFLARKGVHLEARRFRDNTRKVSEIVSVEYVGEQDVYCLKVDSKDHHFICNGIVTHNCSEIFLPTGEGRSAVCCLSSLNLEYFDEWCETTIVEDMIEFLDDVLQYFIENAPPQLKRAIHSAISERSLGLGTMGFHSLLQSKMIAFESALANGLNRRVFSHIKGKAVEATVRLAKERGEYLDGVGTGRRNSHLLAIAPNANSAIILDTSPSIEPWKSNAYTHRTRAGSFLQVNKYLKALLESKEGVDVEEAIESVILNEGSVQHLDCLSEYEKNVFKTAFELDQMWIIEHASVRQEWVCQGQSVNLFFPAGSDKNYVHAVHLSAWKKGLKSLYYLRSSSSAKSEKVSEKIERKALKDYEIEECMSCQG